MSRTSIVAAIAGGVGLTLLGTVGSLDAGIRAGDRVIPTWQLTTDYSFRTDELVPGFGGWKLVFSSMGAACFTYAFIQSSIVERQEEDLALMRQRSRAMSQTQWAIDVKKREIEAEKELEAHEVLAEQQATQYFMQNAGLPPATAPIADLPQQPQPVAQQPVPVQATPIPDQPVQWQAAPQAVSQQPSPPTKDTACPILDELVVSSRSTVFAAETGTGKSVSQSYLLTRLNQKFPSAQVWVICQKNDSFNGLRDAGRVSLFDPLNPALSFDALNTIWDIFDQRRKTPESDRSQFKTQPVRLMLADWHSIYEAIKSEDWYRKDVAVKLSTIITVGRELNICLLVDTQSYNVKSLGLTEDANIRSNLNVICQGYSWTDAEGVLHGGFSMLENLLRNAYLVPGSDDRELLKTRFNQLVPLSKQQNTPVFFTSVGNPRLELLPDLRAFKPGLLESTAPAPVDTYTLMNEAKRGGQSL